MRTSDRSLSGNADDIVPEDDGGSVSGQKFVDAVGCRECS